MPGGEASLLKEEDEDAALEKRVESTAYTGSAKLVGVGLAQRSTWPFGDTVVSAGPTAGSARLYCQRRKIVRHVLSGCVGLVRRFREAGEDEPRGELPADLVGEGVTVFKCSASAPNFVARSSAEYCVTSL